MTAQVYATQQAFGRPTQAQRESVEKGADLCKGLLAIYNWKEPLIYMPGTFGYHL